MVHHAGGFRCHAWQRCHYRAQNFRTSGSPITHNVVSNSELLHVMVQWLLEESVAPRQDVSAVVEADDGEGEGDRLSPFGLLAGDDY